MIFAYLTICFLILLSCIILSSSFFIRCAAVFFFLGIVLKFFLFLFGYPLGGESAEPIGLFIPSEGSLNEVATIILVGILSFGITSSLMNALFRSSTNDSALLKADSQPPSIVSYIFFIYFIFIATASFINYNFKFNIIGLHTNVLSGIANLAWGWLMSHGFFLIATYFLLQGMKGIPQKRVLYLVLTITIGFLVTTFRLSRGYIFYALPILISFFINDNNTEVKKNRKDLSFLAAFFATLFVLNVFLTSHLRDQVFIKYISPQPSHFSEIIDSIPQSISTKQNTQTRGQSQTLSLLNRVTKLVTNRWIGLEGVMSAQSYKEKSVSSLFKAFASPPKTNLTFYDSQVTHSQYARTNNDNVKFATLPGPIGFFYISGSLWIVSLSMILLTAFGVLLEKAAECMIPKNHYAHSYFSCFLALSFSQFGYLPLHTLAHILSILVFFLMTSIIARLINSKYPTITKCLT